MIVKEVFQASLRFRKFSRGQNLVEFALVLPLLLIMFMGIFDFGWILNQQIQMDNAIRQAARSGAVGDTNAEIIASIHAALTFTVPDSAITIDVRNSAGVSIGNPNDRTPDNRIYVKLQRNNVPLVTPLGSFITGLTAINLHSQAEFLIE